MTRISKQINKCKFCGLSNPSLGISLFKKDFAGHCHVAGHFCSSYAKHVRGIMSNIRLMAYAKHIRPTYAQRMTIARRTRSIEHVLYKDSLGAL